MTGKTGQRMIIAAGLMVGLSGCMSTLEKDVPFVSRFKTDETALANKSAGADAPGKTTAKNPFAFLKGNSGGKATEKSSTDKSQKSGKTFASLFAKKPKSEDQAASRTTGGAGFGALFGKKEQAQPVASPEAQRQAKESAESVIISGLQARRSILPSGSSYDHVASAVLAANSRAAEAELRAARMRAVAASKNWLPSIGPSLSLSSLGEFVASLVIEQVIFDNGRKKAERDFAKADVEVAAVALSQDTNERVFTALSLYLTAQSAEEKAALATTAFNDMSHFEYIMSERVRGGVSDRSDLVVLRQKLAEIKSEMSSNREARNAAMAELNAMSLRPLDGISGVPTLSVNGLSATPLPILMAEAEKERAVAEATAERAANLPGLKAVGKAGSNGKKTLGLQASSDKLFGFGTAASLKAIEATKEGAQRKVGQAREDSNRRLRALEAQLSGLQRQASEAKTLSVQSKRNLDLFQAQYKAGTRQVMDVVGVYETYARQQKSAADLSRKEALIRLEIAKEMGLLADGGAI